MKSADIKNKLSSSSSSSSSLGNKHPDLAKLWHPEKNGQKTPKDVLSNSAYLAWWLCDKNISHEWQQSVKSRAARKLLGCPHCYRAANTLSALFPKVAQQWHPWKNGSLRPDAVAAKSGQRAWWQCDKVKSHVWETEISQRTIAGTNCPHCFRRTVRETQSLALVAPDVAKEWHPTLNGTLRPEDVSSTSHKKVWWRCSIGVCLNQKHDYQAEVRYRIKGVAKCPDCPRSSVQDKNRLSTKFPEIAAEWHPTKNRLFYPTWLTPLDRKSKQKNKQLKNRRLLPSDVSFGSHELVWWQCKFSSEHLWQASVNSRTSNNTGCPFCSGNKVATDNNLFSKFPLVAKFWHTTRNRLTADQVMPSSHAKYWWRCLRKADHVWQATVVSMTRAGSGRSPRCPVCSGKKIEIPKNDNQPHHLDQKSKPTNSAVKIVSLSETHPNIASQWHPTMNETLTPAMFKADSGKEVWWYCPKGSDHVWQGKIRNRVRAKGKSLGCPFCESIRASHTNSLAALFPKVAAQMHPTKNGMLTAEQIVAGSHKKIWWQCPVGPDHEWQTPVKSRTYAGNNCPFCRSLYPSVTNSLASVAPDLAALWHPTKNGDLKPDRIAVNSNRRFWWKCARGDDHEWQASPSTKYQNQSGCPFCAGTMVSKTNSLATLFPRIAALWHPSRNGVLTPNQIVAGSNRRVWWKCPEGDDHEWETSPQAKIKQETGCPFCASKMISKTNCLSTLYPALAKLWHPSKNGKLTPFDVFPSSNKSYWWKCATNSKHSWQAPPYYLVRGRMCPLCER